MQDIYFKINESRSYCLQVDELTYRSLKGNINSAVNYLQELINQELISVEEDIMIIERSLDGISYELLVNRNLEECDENIIEGSNDETDNSTQSSVNDEEVNKVTDKADCAWTEAETRLLLDKYEYYLKMIGPMKKFKTKKTMWIQISSDLKQLLNICKTPQQCENRYKTIIKRKKKAIDNNNKTGSSRMTVDYENELNKISALDDSIQPEVLRGVKNCIVKNIQGVSDENRPKKRKKEKSVQEVLLEIHNKKEESKERRHKERLETLKELGNLFVAAKHKNQEESP